MKKRRMKSFRELVQENKQSLMNDPEALRKIEERLEKKYFDKAE
jgi:hypothetical protein